MTAPSHVGRATGAARQVARWLMISLLFLEAVTLQEANATSAAAQARDLADTARSVPRGQPLRIEGLKLDGEDSLTGLELKRFDVLAEGARMVAQGNDGPHTLQPAVPVYLRGTVDGRAGSVAVISVRESGEIRGLISTSSATWLLGASKDSAAGLVSSKVDAAALARARRFACQVRDNPARAAAPAPTAPAPGAAALTPQLPIAYTANIAVELDYEYFSQFGSDVEEAALYALDLVAFTGTISESELGMNVLVPFLQVWTTASDPYSGGSERLDQLLAWWNSNDPSHCGGVPCSSIERTTVLYLSSAPTGGVAYLPGICGWYANPLANYSYAYAGSIFGNFDISNPASVWDIVVTSHELGHNFGSTHTHCFSPPIDECYGQEEGCYAGPASLPPGCPGPDQGCGTIMGYCHLLSGGTGNVALTYGSGHPYGTVPDRVPAAMLSELAAQYAAAPECLAPTAGMRTLAVTKAGNGSGVVTTVAAGIDCGSVCHAYFNVDEVVQLVAAPSAFSDFAGWSGDPDCSDGSVTMSASVSCTATFNGNCGPSNEDCEDNDICTLDTCVADDHCSNAGTPLSAASCFTAAAAKLQITDSAKLGGDRLTWKWSKGEAVDQGDLGSPATDTTYTLCIYDSSAASANLAGRLTVPPSIGLWQDRNPNGWKYSNKAGWQDGVTKIDLKTGIDGKAKVTLSARGSILALPPAFSGSEFFDQDPSVVVQLRAGAECWTSEFVAPGTKLNSAGGFKAVAP